MTHVAASTARVAFKGNNFMTPRILGYYAGMVSGHRAYIELSEGEGIYGDPLFGVSFRSPKGEHMKNFAGKDPSDVFRSRSEAMEYIKKYQGEPCE